MGGKKETKKHTAQLYSTHIRAVKQAGTARRRKELVRRVCVYVCGRCLQSFSVAALPANPFALFVRGLDFGFVLPTENFCPTYEDSRHICLSFPHLARFFLAAAAHLLFLLIHADYSVSPAGCWLNEHHSNTASAKRPGPYGDYMCDSPWSLLE